MSNEAGGMTQQRFNRLVLTVLEDVRCLRIISKMVHGNAWGPWLESGKIYLGRKATNHEIAMLKKKRQEALSP